MARVILNGDRIKKITADDKLGVEVGELPKGVGLERLRWDGEKIVDLAELEEMYVNPQTKTLHVVQQRNTQRVQMSYNERFYLTNDNGTLRVKTPYERDEEQRSEYKARRRTEYPAIGDQLGAIMDYLKGRDDLTPELQTFQTKIQEVKDRWKK